MPVTSAGGVHTSGGRVLLQCPVRPVDVAVIGILARDEPQVPLARDQHPVQALAKGAARPAFRDRVRTRRLDRSLDDPRADRGGHRIERRSERGIPVPDQELEAVSVLLEVHQKVTGLPGHRVPGGISGDARQMHARGAMPGEEQHTPAAHGHGTGMEEVRRALWTGARRE